MINNMTEYFLYCETVEQKSCIFYENNVQKTALKV